MNVMDDHAESQDVRNSHTRVPFVWCLMCYIIVQAQPAELKGNGVTVNPITLQLIYLKIPIGLWCHSEGKCALDC